MQRPSFQLPLLSTLAGLISAIFRRSESFQQSMMGNTTVMVDQASSKAGEVVKPLPVIGKYSESRQRTIAVGLVAGSLVIALIAGVAGFIEQRKGSEFRSMMSSIMSESIDLRVLARLSHEGEKDLFEKSEKALSGFKRDRDLVATTSPSLFVSVSDNAELVAGMDETIKAFASLMVHKENLIQFADTIERSRERMARAADLLTQIVAMDRAAGGSVNSDLLAHMQESATRGADLIGRFIAGEKNSDANMRILATDVATVTRLGHYFTTGAPGVKIVPLPEDMRSMMQKVVDDAQQVSLYAYDIDTDVASFSYAHLYSDRLESLASKIEKTATARGEATMRSLSTTLLFLVAALGFLASMAGIALMQAIHSRSARVFAIQTRKEKDDGDEAVTRLMHELRPISKGNLTARATVTEHVTGAVADQINYVTENLADAINEVKSAAKEADNIMGQIRDVTSSSMSQFEDATFSAAESRSVAELGASAVTDAVETLDMTREQMQEVLKRVKRLGEIAQAITPIVGMIEEMTQKTGVLALNTALKATDAGEEGRAFQVIAEQIDDLSKDANRALSDIARNVQNIQVETQSVIQTVETVAQGIVEGSRQWDEARITLSSVTQASQQIEKTISDLQNVAKSQTDMAMNASSVMLKLTDSVGQFVTTHEEAATV